MTRTKALLLGGFTLWPVVFMFMLTGFMFVQLFEMNMGSKPLTEEMVLLMKIITPCIAVTVLLSFFLTAVYIGHIYRTGAIPRDKKPLWIFAIICGNMIAMPVYWYLYIWKKNESENSGRPARGAPDHPFRTFRRFCRFLPLPPGRTDGRSKARRQGLP